MHLQKRRIIVALLLAVLGGLCVHYGATYDENWPHPTGDQLQEQGPEPFVGERMLLFGEVQTVDADTITIHVIDDNDNVAAKLKVHGAEKPVEPGGVVQVYGVIESETELHANQTVVVNRNPSATMYKLGTSVVGLLLAVAYFFRQWQIDFEKLAFKPRTTTHDSESEEVHHRG
ncbi:DNA-binding protein [Natrinema sp. HArc-T2]|uniref:DNA-binding protein n=1 Tax=Natrinema sp. HArc-T2 TaxID=3242701 RepID=UPI00359E7C16